MKSKRVFYPFAVMASLILVGCSSSQQKSEQAVVRPVKYTQVSSLSTYSQIFSGVVMPERFSNLAFRVPGQITNLKLDIGQKIQKGQLIAELDMRDFNLQVEVMRSSFETAKAQYDRNKILYNKQAISKQELEISLNNYNSAKVSYENAKNSLTDTRLYAPFSGSIETKFVENYQKVQAGEAIVKLVDPKDIYISFTIADRNIVNAAKESIVFWVEFPAYADKKFKTKIREVLDISPDGSGIPISLNIVDPQFEAIRNEIKPGFTCKVLLNVTNIALTDNLVVPLVAIFNNPQTEKNSIWLIDEKSQTVKSVPVTIVRPAGIDQVIIKSDGLAVDDKIVTAGVQQLVDGEKVKL